MYIDKDPNAGTPVDCAAMVPSPVVTGIDLNNSDGTIGVILVLLLDRCIFSRNRLRPSLNSTWPAHHRVQKASAAQLGGRGRPEETAGMALNYLKLPVI